MNEAEREVANALRDIAAGASNAAGAQHQQQADQQQDQTQPQTGGGQQ